MCVEPFSADVPAAEILHYPAPIVLPILRLPPIFRQSPQSDNAPRQRLRVSILDLLSSILNFVVILLRVFLKPNA